MLNELYVPVLILLVSWEDVNTESACYFGARMRKMYVILRLCCSFFSISVDVSGCYMYGEHNHRLIKMTSLCSAK